MTVTGEATAPYRYSYFTEYVSGIYPLPEALKEAVRQRTFSMTIRKGDFLLKQGEICSAMYLIKKGLTRAYIIRGNQEITTWISVENDWETSVNSFFNGVPANENVKALENCQLEGIYAKDLEYLYTHFPEANIVARLILTEYYQTAEDRALMCRIANATEKYKYFLEKRGHLVNRVPLKYIASFLGIRLETLCRLRNKFHSGSEMSNIE